VFACYLLFIKECKQFRIEIDKVTNRDTIDELILFYDALSKMMVTWIKEDQEKEECHER
jgi:ribonuclease HI